VSLPKKALYIEFDFICFGQIELFVISTKAYKNTADPCDRAV